MFARGQSPLQSPSANNYGQQVIGLDQKGTEMEEDLVHVAVNTLIINKNQNKQNLGQNWINYKIPLSELADGIKAGFAYCSKMKAMPRNKTNFWACNIVSIDVDEDLRIDVALNDPFSQKHLTMFYTTSSHTEQEHRFRLVFKLPRVIESAEEFRKITRALQLKYGGDPASTDVARIFYGNDRCAIQIWDRSIPEDVFQELLATFTEPISDVKTNGKANASLRSDQKLSPDLELITKDGRVIKLSDVDKTVSIYCPRHRDKNPSAFASLSEKGNRFVHCSKCQVSWYEDKPLKNIDDKYEFVKVMKEVSSLNPDQISDKILDVSKLFDHEKLEPPRIIFSNDKHLQLDEISPGLTLIRSPKGSGKTESMVGIVERAIFRKRQLTLEDFEAIEPDDQSPPQRLIERTSFRVLLIGHRRALIRNLCERLGLHCYLDESTSGSIWESGLRRNQFGVCFDSIYKVSFTTVPYDIVLVDEVEQVLAHLLSSTVRDRYGYFRAFKQLISNAKSVVALDADLGWTSYLTLTSMRATSRIKPDDNKLTVMINEYKSGGNEIEIFENKNQLIGEIIGDIKGGRRVYVSSNSKLRIDRTHKAIQSEYPEVKTISVTSDNSNDDDTQNFIVNAAQESLNYQVVLASPSIGTGVDITFPDDEKIFKAVYGIYEPLVNTHTDIDQQISRVRHPEKVKVWISPRTFNFETEFNVIKTDLLSDHILANTSVGMSLKHSESINLESDEFLRFAALVVSNQRKSKNELKNNFIRYKVENGWNIKNVTDKDLSSAGVEFSEIGSRLELEKYIQLLLTSQPISKEDYNDIRFKMDRGETISEDAAWSMRRMRIELFFRAPISTENIIEFDRGKLSDKWWLFSKTLDIEAKRFWSKSQSTMDIDKAKLQLRTMKDSESGGFLLSDLLATTTFFDGNKFDTEIEFTSTDLTTFIKKTKTLKPYLETQLGDVNIRKDIDKKPIQQLGVFLDLIGLQVFVCRTQRTQTGGKTYHYKLDLPSLTKMMDLNDLKNDPIDPWIEIHARYGFPMFYRSEDEPEVG